MTSGPEGTQPEPSQPDSGRPDLGAPEPTQPYGSGGGSAMPPPPPPPPFGTPSDVGAPPPPPFGQPSQPGQPGQPGMAQPGMAPAYAGGYAASPEAPYGVDPRTGIPYSDKQKLVAGLLQIFLGGFGVGRFYIGDTQTAVLQIVVTVFTCGIGGLWGLIDGIIMLTKDDARDARGYILRPG